MLKVTLQGIQCLDGQCVGQVILPPHLAQEKMQQRTIALVS